jgi:hypothetical protein
MLGLALEKKPVLVGFHLLRSYGDPLVHPQSEDYWGNVNPWGRAASMTKASALRRRW